MCKLFQKTQRCSLVNEEDCEEKEEEEEEEEKDDKNGPCTSVLDGMVGVRTSIDGK